MRCLPSMAIGRGSGLDGFFAARRSGVSNSLTISHQCRYFASSPGTGFNAAEHARSLGCAALRRSHLFSGAVGPLAPALKHWAARGFGLDHRSASAFRAWNKAFGPETRRPTLAQDMARGKFSFAGATVTGRPVDVIDAAPPSPQWATHSTICPGCSTS